MLRNRKQKVKEDEQSLDTQMEGISSAHSWIKSNTMLRPTKLGKKKGGGGAGAGGEGGEGGTGGGGSEEDDDETDIMIMLTSSNPNTVGNNVRCSTINRSHLQNNLATSPGSHLTENLFR